MFDRLKSFLTLKFLTVGSFRWSAVVLALIVGLHSLWFLTAEVLRPVLPFFPANKDDAVEISSHAGKAALAASVGLLRSDLWTDYALTLADGTIFGPALTSEAATKELHAVAERAVRLGPHEARAWLLLAAADARFDWLNRNIAGPLRMSYLTGPSEFELMPLRLSIATQSDAITDSDLQVLVEGDLTAILLRHRDMKPIIAAVYRDATVEGKRFISKTVARLDPDFATELK